MGMKFTSFTFSPSKFIESVAYILAHVGPSTRMKIVKLLYLADRDHVVKHGTPILGDMYVRLQYGPVPSRGLDILEAVADITAGNPEVESDQFSQDLLKYITVKSPDSKRAEYECTTPPELKALARSEVESLDLIIKEYGTQSGPTLSQMTHQHKAYTDTRPSEMIDYRLFFIDHPEAKEEALSYLEFSQEDRELLEALR